MTPEQFQEVSRIYQQAAALAVAERPQYLVAACAGDEALRAEVEALLRYEDKGAFLDQPALEAATQILKKDQCRSLSGQQVGHCQLRSLLGQGGMGEVWLAEDTQLRRQVAVKLLPEEFTADAARVHRFKQEAQAASALNHPNILTIHEIGTFATEAATTHYIVTELIDGETLRERMRQTPNAQMPAALAVELCAQIAAALAAAHEAGVIHRDIKPENVMVRKDGLVKVLDFGLAKLTERKSSDAEAPTQPWLSTEAGMVMGTPRYMSPEQARGERVDARTDIFSLGVMLYEMIAGVPPFAGATVSETIAAILRDEPSPLARSAAAAPMELQHIVNRALQKDRTARYEAMPELLTDLKRLQRQLERQEEAPLLVPLSLSEVATARLNSAAQTAEPAAGMTAPQFSRLLKRHKLSGAIAIVLLLAAVAIAVYFSVRETAIDSLAVLPFVNVGANADAEYLSDGITDRLINSLSQLPKLKMMSRNSVFRYKGKDADAQQVGNALGVRAVLTGKVTQHGDDLLVSAELIDVRDNSHLWGAQYSYKMSNLPTVQTDLARDVSQQLRLKLSGAEQQQLAKRGTDNPEAYELYLKGRYHLNAQLRESEKRSLEYFRQAIEKDAGFAPAYAGLAEACMSLTAVNTTMEVAPKELFQQAKAAATKAVELDSTLAEAHLALARIAEDVDWDWSVAEREFKRAIELDPNFVPAHHFYSHYLVLMNRFEESLAEGRRALAFDPLDVGMNFHLGWNYYNVRQYDQAEAQLKKTLEMNPNHSGARGVLGRVYVQQGRYQEAIAAIQKCIEQGGRDMRGTLGHAYAVAGQRDEAQKLIKQLQAEATHKYVSPHSIAKIYAGLGEQEQAFAWLERALAEYDRNLSDPGLNVDVVFDGLRADPRFADLLRRMGLAN